MGVKRWVVVFLCLGLPSASLLQAQDFYYAQKAKFTDSTQSRQSSFARALDVEDGYILIGDPADDLDSALSATQVDFKASGVVSAYRQLPDSSWIASDRFTANDRAEDALFGTALAMQAQLALIGAPGNNTDVNGDSLAENCGAVYVFERNAQGQWNQIQKFTANDAGPNKRFGQAVALSQDFALIRGVEAVGSSNAVQGVVYVFFRGNNDSWFQWQKIIPPDSLSFSFGQSLAIVEDRALILSGKEVSLNGNSFLKSIALLYRLDSLSGQWRIERSFSSTDTSEITSFALERNRLFVGEQSIGANSASEMESISVFERQNVNWNGLQRIASPLNRPIGFGRSIAFSNGILAAAAPLDDTDAFGQDSILNAGAVYLYTQNSSTSLWEFSQKIVPRDRFRLAPFGNSTIQINNQRFGNSLAFQKSDLLIGTTEAFRPPFSNWYYDIGSAYVYEVCNPENTSLNIKACDSYTWPLNNRTYDTAGTYIGVVANRFNCDSIVELNLSFASSDFSSSTIERCYRYLWPANNRLYKQSGRYSLRLQNSDGCDSVVQLNLTILEREAAIHRLGNLLQSVHEAESYQWLDCAASPSPIQGATGKNFQVSKNGRYALVTQNGSCADTSDCVLVGGLGIDDRGQCVVLSVNPVPSNDLVRIELARTFERLEVQVFNYAGRLVALQSFENTDQIDYPLPPADGVYVLRLISESCSVALRVVKVK